MWCVGECGGCDVVVCVCVGCGWCVWLWRVWMSVLLIVINCYFDNYFECFGVKLLLNEFYMMFEDMVLMIVFGLCVVVCLYDLYVGIGGMNYFMLLDDGVDLGVVVLELMCYGVYVMEVLINELIKVGGCCECFEVKVFGGVVVLVGMMMINIGDCNVDFVCCYFVFECICIIVEDL